MSDRRWNPGVSMPEFTPRGCAFNRTRQVFLATTLALADTHWSRLRGLVGASPGDFGNGWGLWIVPCRGVHTLAMRFARIRIAAASVLELPRQALAATGTAVGDKIEITLDRGGKSAR